ncbi:MAG: endopeptidase La [Deltaproteobacteria bacterium]|nr:endopeptidase La [Deltaproteobacteria bacterium]
MTKKSKSLHPKPVIPNKLPVLPVLSVVVFPFAIVQLLVRRDKNITLLNSMKSSQNMIALASPKDPTTQDPQGSDLNEFGVVAKIVNKVNLSDHSTQIVLQGIARIQIKKYTQEDPYLVADIVEVEDTHEDDLETKVLFENLIELFNRFVTGNPRYSQEITRIVEMNIDEGPSVISDLIASYVNFTIEEKQKILEALDVKDRMKKITQLLSKELEFSKVETEIQGKAKHEMERSQREYFLRRQLEEIKKELGEEDGSNSDILQLRERLKANTYPAEVSEVIEKELSRLERINPNAADYHVIRTYLDWLTELPWMRTTTDHLNIIEAKKILDEDHHGLQNIKERILEYLAVLKLKKDLKGPILCFAGPPGVGKTSLGQSIARALGRKFVRISLGGVRDEAEIRGHRRTYVGALPGRILQGIKKAGTRNPLFMIDEVDKISGERGDPAAALLEVLDPAQNFSFRDNYIEVPFDLSQVMFITTANMLDAVPGALRDRMEVIKLPGYTLEEKIEIALHHLVPRQIQDHGLNPKKVHFTDEAVKKVVKGYTREAGVRNLEREMGHICRKIAKHIAEGTTEDSFQIKASSIEKYLGLPKFLEEEVMGKNEIGVAQGLAWTHVGGALMQIETTKIQGQLGIKFTGQLGDVMKESIQAALSYIQSNAEALHISQDDFRCLIHVHFPAASIPKDGPSAGTAIATAIASLMTKRPFDKTVAMTGEISLRGHVLPVGGIKEKVLAAYRGGIKTIILPEKNKNDLVDIPAEIQRKIQFKLVGHVQEVFDIALLPAQKTKVKKAKTTGTEKKAQEKTQTRNQATG